MLRVNVMRQPPTYISWKISCRSCAETQSLQQWLAGRIDMDRVITDTVRAAPEGVEQIQIIGHRLGDYFADIRMLPDSEENHASFRLVFHRRTGAERFWKDLMVNILEEIEATTHKASIELDSKGETEPITPGTVPS